MKIEQEESKENQLTRRVTRSASRKPYNQPTKPRRSTPLMIIPQSDATSKKSKATKEVISVKIEDTNEDKDALKTGQGKDMENKRDVTSW